MIILGERQAGRRRLESHHPSEPVVSSLFFFSLINVDPTDVGDRDCRMLKKDYPSYACFQCQYDDNKRRELLSPRSFWRLDFHLLDLGSVQIASNRGRRIYFSHRRSRCHNQRVLFYLSSIAVDFS